MSYIHEKRRVRYVYTQPLIGVFFIHGNGNMHAWMKSVLLQWTPSLKDHSKLKGKCTDVQSGCGTSIELA